ncbi:hypothetical protein D3C72_2552770 [compost metagenome]
MIAPAAPDGASSAKPTDNKPNGRFGLSDSRVCASSMQASATAPGLSGRTTLRAISISSRARGSPSGYSGWL